jgi:hypothetical protein
MIMEFGISKIFRVGKYTGDTEKRVMLKSNTKAME